MTANLRCICFVAIVLTAQATRAVRAEVSQEDVLHHIEELKSLLFDRQDRYTGNWEFRSRPGGIRRDIIQAGGETALATQALLVSGESSQNPRLVQSLKYLQELDIIGTYAMSMRAHVWAQLPNEYKPLLERDASWLLNAAINDPHGLFDYQAARTSAFIDNSVVQYGVLGLWEASKRGLKIPRRHWEQWAEYFLRTQQPNGSWVATAAANKAIGGAGSGNIFDTQGIGAMTTAGLTTLLIAQQELFRDREYPEPKITSAIQKGMDWLDRHFDIESGRSGYNHYYLYGVEQVALASGVRYLNGLDWYQAGADQIIHDKRLRQGVEEYDSLKLSFALMFLSRGQFPVWINKLQVPGIAWNNHPNDLHFLSLYLSRQREEELNWQTIGINEADPSQWLVSPVTYLASDAAVTLTPKQEAAIKQYLQMGGLLVTSPDRNSRDFSKSIRALAEKLYPDYEMRPLEEDHPLFGTWHILEKNERLPVYGVSNGVRELILLIDSDWGYTLQADSASRRDIALKLAANLFSYASGKGVLNNRLVAPFDRRVDRPTTRTVKVGRARYNGNWLPEAEAWPIQANYIFNRTGIDVEPTPASGEGVLELKDIGDSKLKLIHVTGTQPAALTTPQLDAITAYTQRGGTLLVECVGGKGKFSWYVLDQLAELFDQQAVRLTSEDAMVSGTGLAGGTDCQRALYRRYSVVTFGTEPRPHLAAFLDKNGRPSVIVSHEDLSLGMLGCRHWDINGYSPETARNLMTNLVIWVSEQAYP